MVRPSVALAVSGAGILYQKPLTSAVAMRWLLYSLAFSSICLWASLLTSLCHNFVAAYVLHLESKFAFYNATMRSTALLAAMDKENLLGGNEKELGEEEVRTLRDFLGEQGMKERQRANKFREWGMPLSVIAVSLFALGYLSVVAYVVVLAISIR